MTFADLLVVRGFSAVVGLDRSSGFDCCRSLCSAVNCAGNVIDVPCGWIDVLESESDVSCSVLDGWSVTADDLRELSTGRTGVLGDISPVPAGVTDVLKGNDDVPNIADAAEVNPVAPVGIDGNTVGGSEGFERPTTLLILFATYCCRYILLRIWDLIKFS